MESICVCVGKQKRCLRIKDTFAWVWVLWVGESCHIPWHSVIRVAFAGTKVGEMFVFSVKLLCAAIIRGFIQNWNICWVSLWKLYNNRTKSGGFCSSRVFNMSFSRPPFNTPGFCLFVGTPSFLVDCVPVLAQFIFMASCSPVYVFPTNGPKSKTAKKAAALQPVVFPLRFISVSVSQ